MDQQRVNSKSFTILENHRCRGSITPGKLCDRLPLIPKFKI